MARGEPSDCPRCGYAFCILSGDSWVCCACGYDVSKPRPPLADRMRALLAPHYIEQINERYDLWAPPGEARVIPWPLQLGAVGPGDKELGQLDKKSDKTLLRPSSDAWTRR